MIFIRGARRCRVREIEAVAPGGAHRRADVGDIEAVGANAPSSCGTLQGLDGALRAVLPALPFRATGKTH